MTDAADLADEGYPVALASGAPLRVMTPAEVEYVEERVEQYKSTYQFENVSDVQDLDRIIIKELLCYRYGHFLALGQDWFRDPIDEKDLSKRLNDLSGELRLMKKQVGIDKATREKESGADSIPAYLENLRQRAKAFGISRNMIMAKGIALSSQVIALATLYRNCNEAERMENQCTAEDIMHWILDVYIPEFRAVDEEFRRTQQTLWIQEM